jgi:hypothetical protein
MPSVHHCAFHAVSHGTWNSLPRITRVGLPERQWLGAPPPPSPAGAPGRPTGWNRKGEVPRVDRRQAYELEILSTFARFGTRAPEISDTDRDHEFLAQKTFFAALADFRRKVERAQTLTEFRKDALGDLLAALADATPDVEAWDEAITNARRGY